MRSTYMHYIGELQWLLLVKQGVLWKLQVRYYWFQQTLKNLFLAYILSHWAAEFMATSHKVLIVLINLLKPTGYLMHQQFNIQQLYVLPTLYLCVLYLSENKQRLVPLTA
jgi:hypothetical protein